MRIRFLQKIPQGRLKVNLGEIKASQGIGYGPDLFPGGGAHVDNNDMIALYSAKAPCRKGGLALHSLVANRYSQGVGQGLKMFQHIRVIQGEFSDGWFSAMKFSK